MDSRQDDKVTLSGGEMRIDYRKGSVDMKMARVASSMKRLRGSFKDGGSWYDLIGTHAAKLRD